MKWRWLTILLAVCLFFTTCGTRDAAGPPPGAPEPPAATGTPSPSAAPVPTGNPTAAPEPPPSVLPLAGAKIGIDAGHQGRGNYEQESSGPGSRDTKPKVTTGTTGRVSGMPEHVLNLQVALALEQALADLGAEIIMTRRTADVDISNTQRAIMMNKAGVDFCLRIHANGHDNPDIYGALMILPAEAAAPDISGESLRLGETILGAYIVATGAKSMGTLEAPEFAGFNWSRVPTCLIEMGFMTNPAEDTLLASPLYQAKIVRGLVDGILLWYGG